MPDDLASLIKQLRDLIAQDKRFFAENPRYAGEPDRASPTVLPRGDRPHTPPPAPKKARPKPAVPRRKSKGK